MNKEPRSAVPVGWMTGPPRGGGIILVVVVRPSARARPSVRPSSCPQALQISVLNTEDGSKYHKHIASAIDLQEVCPRDLQGARSRLLSSACPTPPRPKTRYGLLCCFGQPECAIVLRMDGNFGPGNHYSTSDGNNKGRHSLTAETFVFTHSL